MCEHGRIRPERGLQHLLISIYHHPAYNIIDFTPDVLLRLSEIAPGLHKDPADQIILATAMELKASLMTDDKTTRASGLVEVL